MEVEAEVDAEVVIVEVGDSGGGCWWLKAVEGISVGLGSGSGSGRIG